MRIKGQKEYERFKNGESLTRKQAMLANCYMCNGLEDSSTDCLGKSCPIYKYRPYQKQRKSILQAISGSFITLKDNQKAGVQC